MSTPTLDGLRSSQVAEASGVNLQTLRYYERRGLIAEPNRSYGGHRIYPAATVTRVRVIKTAQRVGFTLDEIADLLRVGTRGHHLPASAGLQAQARTKLAEVDARIADLTTIRTELVAALEAGCDDLLVCADSECCPLPFAQIGARPADEATQS